MFTYWFFMRKGWYILEGWVFFFFFWEIKGMAAVEGTVVLAFFPLQLLGCFFFKIRVHTCSVHLKDNIASMQLWGDKNDEQFMAWRFPFKNHLSRLKNKKIQWYFSLFQIHSHSTSYVESNFWEEVYERWYECWEQETADLNVDA